MWVNPLYDATHRQDALDLVRDNPLATVIVGGPVRVSHVPVLLETHPDGSLELVGHMPRVDPAVSALIDRAVTTVVFHGPRSYVSPSTYVAPGLPTYNYLVAHAEGTARVMDDPEELRAHLMELTARQEERGDVEAERWTFDDIAFARMDKLMPLIVGFRIPVERLQVKAKLGQNRSVDDQRSAAAALHKSPRTDDQEVAQKMVASSEERARES